MKEIVKNTTLILIFFLVFLFKENIYGIFIKVNKLDNITKEVEDIKNNYYYEEYYKLLDEMDINVTDAYSYEYSKILYRDIYDYYNEITILKGKNDNIKNGSAIINEYGLIGTIKKVNKNSSVVTLISNKESSISIKVNNAYGLLVYENNKLMLKSINNYENIKIGDIVYTSGIGTLPGNIKIGEITAIKEDELGIEQKIYIEPFVNFDNINYVAILKGENLWFCF